MFVQGMAWGQTTDTPWYCSMSVLMSGERLTAMAVCSSSSSSSLHSNCTLRDAALLMALYVHTQIVASTLVCCVNGCGGSCCLMINFSCYVVPLLIQVGCLEALQVVQNARNEVR